MEKGEYRPLAVGEPQSLCPVLNALVNHRFIPRDGRIISADQFKDVLKYIGAGIDIRYTLVKGAFKVHTKTSPIRLLNTKRVVLAL